MKGGPFGYFFPKNVAQYRKKLKWGCCSLARYCMLRGKKGKPFLAHMPFNFFDDLRQISLMICDRMDEKCQCLHWRTNSVQRLGFSGAVENTLTF